MSGQNIECSAGDYGSNIIGQQLFLGSSISSFSSSTGWGGSSSTLTVELVDDYGCLGTGSSLEPIFKGDYNPSLDNHYYNCIGNDCYMDENGLAYDPEISKQRIVPGKVYHRTKNNSPVSKYWRYGDPGFFGQATRIRPDGTWNNSTNPNAGGGLFRYDLIGVPAYFRFGYFTFGGIIDSWMANNRTSTTTYTVSLSSANSILKNSKVIISKYAGSIFAKIGAGDIAGGPTNYTGYAGSYRGLLSQGNIPNVFNVYGFLESYGFGTSNANDRGIPLSYILDALSVLTSVSLPTANTYQNNLSNIFPNVLSNSNNKDLLGYHSAFSPFGRIICRTMMTDDQINPRPFYIPGQESDNNFSFGVMNPSLDEFGVHRVEFLLDLSEIPRPPIDVRYYGSDGIASINDIIEQACDKSGRDWYTTIVRRNGLNFIKIKTVDRTTTVPTNTVESVIKTLEEASPSIPVTNSSFGKEKNDSAKPRVMYIGGNQQRLFQTKSYLLGYSNTHLVYHPQLKKFVNYYRLCENTSDSNADASPGLEIQEQKQPSVDDRRGPTSRDRTNDYIKTINKRDKWTNSYRIPMAYSTRNLLLSNLLNGPIVTQLVANEQAIAEGSSAVAASAFNSVFDKVDDFAIDKPVGGKAIVKLGNYWLTYTESICNPAWYRDSNETESLISGCEEEPAENAEDEQVSPDNKPRYIPLWYSSICPFFGYVNDVLVKDNTEKGSNIYRFVRPVYLDTWSGLLVIGFRCNELPALSLGMLPVWYATEMSADGTLITNGSGLQGGNMSGGTPNGTPTAPAGADGGESDPPPGEEPEEEEGEEEGEEPTKSDSPDAYSNNYMINNICFTVTESELRAAQSSKEDYLAYCLMKMPYSKPNLFTMLVAQYQSMGKLKVNQVGGSPINNPSGLGGGGAAGGGVINVAGGSPVGIVGSRRIGATEALNRNFNWILNPDFMRDWERITNFVKGIADKYYGKEYLVKLPTVLSYRDYQYADLQIPLLVDTSVSMSVYQGSGKIFFNYEITDKAWEEPGNYIDDSIIIGSPQYYQLCDNDGRLTPILGYNATPVKDYIAEKWCSFNNIKQKDQWEKSNAPEAIEYNKIKTKIKDAKDDKQKAFLKYKLRKLEATVVGKMMYDCSLLTVPALDLSKMNDQDYILIMGKDSGREDAYSNMTIGTPITLQNGDTIMDPGGGVLYEVDLEDNPYSENIDEKKEKITIGEKLPIPTVKAYFTTTCEEAFVFLDPVYLTDPRARITAPGLNLYPPSTSYKTDPTLIVIANMAAEDYGILEGLKKHSVAQGESGAFLKYVDKITEKMKWYIDGEIVDKADSTLCQGYFNLKRILLGLFTVLDEQGFLLLEDNTANQSPGYYTMSERKAHPFFAAVPLKDNVACYGPWTNYPVLGDQRVFPVLATPPIARISLIEQLINDIDIERNPEWCPWEYGGMSFLDREIINQIEAKTSYQIHLENGTLVTHGMPMFNMSAGLRIKTLDSDVYGFYNRMFMNYTYHTLQTRNFITYSGLTLTNISTSVSDRSISTTYKFQTYSPMLGIYSKEISDRNKLSAKTKIAFLSQAGAQIREINSNLTSTFFSILKQNSTPKDFSSGDGSKYKGMHRGTSPVQYLVGSASFLVPSNGLPYCGDPGLNSEEYKTLLDSVNPDNLKKEGEYLHTITRTKNWVGAFQTSESLAELSSQYNSKSVMSFDGIFSPVSFYPTYNLGTYSISSRFLSATDRASGLTCPMCNGSSLFTHYRGSSKTPTQYPCPLCSKTKLSVPATLEIDIDSPPDINFKSLNPIIMPTGEFQNPNSQVLTNPLERSRHNIRVIGRQERPIDGDISLDTGDNLGIITDENGNTNKDAIDSGQTLSDTSRLSHYNSDYYQYDLDYGSGSTSESESQEPKTKILQNQRFFALRGPMMLHGWGYDTEGYPVPNQADEPVDFDASGRPKRFLLTSSGTNDYTNDGKFLPGEGESLGDIIGRGYVKEGGEWTRKPTRYFHLNWGERSDLWPIGPIDLRWDEERKVWTGGGGGGCGEIDPPYIMASGSNPSILNNFITKAKASSEKSCPYKMVYLVLEENLFSDIGMSESYPARAFLDDSEYGLEPLPYTVRRVVYVNDRCGYSAPRGAKLLCRYNRETGFYEPISKPSFIVFGSVSQGSNTATVELAYIRGIKSAENIPKTNISFDNTRFNFNINAGKSRRGMFLFENGKWILTGFN